ncbi:MAG: DUF3883 domain-containing protein [Stomatobaculum sp.]|nr:DUF3883 domain-containing protein [Stomatobaculum sp.]
MNQTELNKVMNFYIRHYDEIRRREDYKWEAVAAWQASAPMKASSFPEALRAGLKKAGNLLDSGYYYPKTALFMMLSRDPEAVEYMFEDLFCEKDDVYDRIAVFMMKAGALRKKWFTQEELPGDDQDEHAVSVYLSFEMPEKYYIYKYSVFRAAAILLDHSYVPRRKDARNLPEYFSFCEQVRKEVLASGELLRLEQPRREAFPGVDPEYRLLTEDILICAATYYAKPELFEESGTAEKAEQFRLVPVKKELPLEAVPFYDPVEIVRYEELLREAALRFIVSQERLRVREYRLPARKQPEALGTGRARGEGYDILSYDRRGEEVFISVKATAGPESEAFRVTEAERRKSAADPEHYRLYRVYGFSMEEGNGRYSVHRGDLSPFCLNPERYLVMF